MGEENGHVSPHPLAPSGWGCRYTLSVLCFFGSAVLYAMRFNLSLAIVAMVNRTEPSSGPSSSSPLSNVTPSCPNLIEDGVMGIELFDKNVAETTNLHFGGEFDWNEAEQGVILGSFFWGYILTQVPGGILAKMFGGGKWPLGLGLLLSAIFTVITPWAARTHRGLLILARIMEGLGSGLHIASQTALLAAWVPPNERSFLGAIVYGGSSFGTAATLIASGYLIQGNYLGGWPSVFYVTGICSILWFLLWCYSIHNSPADHPRITTEEREYIEKSLDGGHSNISKSDYNLPWKEILTSGPIWAAFVSHVAHCWGIYTLLTEMPTYMTTVLHYNIKNNSWLSAIPYIVSWWFGILFGHLGDVAIRRNLVTTLTVRRTAQILAHFGCALALIACAYSGCSRLLTVSFLILAIGLTGTANSGFIISYVDLAPNYASLIVGVANSLANICGIGAPYTAGLLINNNPSVENWKIVFLIAAAILIFGAVYFVVFASGEEQPWNKNWEKLIEEETEDDRHNENTRKMNPGFISDIPNPVLNGKTS